MNLTEPVYLAALGGFCIQALPFLELYKIPKNRRPDFKDFTYWLPYIIAPIIGGLIGYAYFDGSAPVNKLLAVHIGASAPLLLRSMAALIPPVIKL